MKGRIMRQRRTGEEEDGAAQEGKKWEGKKLRGEKNSGTGEKKEESSRKKAMGNDTISLYIAPDQPTRGRKTLEKQGRGHFMCRKKRDGT